MERQQIAEAVDRSLRDCLDAPPPHINESDELVDLGLDSLKATSLLLFVEDHAGIHLPAGCESELAAAKTVGALITAIATVLREES